ncbi:MAG TPA: 16S rRNA (cytosine(1402)-N(4))-methyltransferase RsmH [Bacteroidales bacterium]|nr:16S rRNA (cytosine(1402)-N(4))-methyltransferase RsmH [Bacteroidales bacterium]
MTYHIPVMLHESIEGLRIKPSGCYVDATFGGGGHSKAILAQLKGGRLFGFDRDEDAMQNIPSDPQFTFVKQNFRYMKNFLNYHGVEKIDGILADLGVSSHQFDEPQRGFMFRADAPLDMRMDKNSNLSAKTLLNEWTEEKLADLFYLYGEIQNARKLAHCITTARSRQAISTTGELVECIRSCIPQKIENKYMAQVFQAIRIEVNGELDNLKQLLEQSAEMLVPSGRLVVITYHSLEDRMVKNFIKCGNVEGNENKDFYGNRNAPFKAINKSVITPSDEELKTNNRSRSAKLRIAEKL